MRSHVLRAQAGQKISLSVTSPYDHVIVSAFGSEDNAVLVSIRSQATIWTGNVPSTQDYTINLVSLAGSETTYSLEVSIVGAPLPTPTQSGTPPPPTTAPSRPTPTTQPTDERDKTIYLTFDDGPVDPQWTPQVLEVLSQYDASATFFVLGKLAQAFPELIEAEVAAGHSVANHTFDHHTLDGIGREGFFSEILETEKILGDKATKCLRPPYGATDGYTRAYAEELGYSLVLWDIDTEDWRRPGPESIESAIVTGAYPGAIVLMHDGGGDRSETVQALRAALAELKAQGYSFRTVVCP
jgi:peptidoglycan/xylan/chitin deacetylase (PgdA/CDA1 family)